MEFFYLENTMDKGRKFVKKFVEALLDTPQMEKFRETHYKGINKLRHFSRRRARIDAMTDVVCMMMSRPYYELHGKIIPEKTSLTEAYVKVDPMVLANAIIGQIDMDISLVKDKTPPRTPLRDS